MSKHFFQSAALRSVLMSGYRIYARAQIGRSGPKVFINSIPKAGTHLVTTILDQIPGLMHSRLHVETWRISTEKHRQPLSEFALDKDAFIRELASVRPGQFASGHIPWHKSVLETLKEQGFQTIFVTRDPEAILRSRFHYITGLRRHPLHRQLMEDYESDEARWAALRNGMPDRGEDKPGTDSYVQYLEAFSGWTRQAQDDQFQIIHFEDLVGEQGGGSDALRIATLDQLASTLAPKILSGTELHYRSVGKKSATYRAGKR